MGTAGACGACAPGLPAGFKQQATTATDARVWLGWGEAGWGGDVCLGGAKVGSGTFSLFFFFPLRCLEVRPDSTLLEVT